MPGVEQGPQEQVMKGQGERKESQEDREARFDRKRLRTNHLTPRQRRVPQLVIHNLSIKTFLHTVFVSR